MKENIGICRFCGKRIRFIKMTSGKTMPVDELLVNYKVDPAGKERIVTPDGKVVCGRFCIHPKDADGTGYISHFATCPKTSGARG